MTVLHIEHPITDYATWSAAFDSFAEARAAAGVLGHRILQPVGDPAYVVIDLDFETVEEADHFLRFLRGQVWASRAASPGLAGEPVTRILAEIGTVSNNSGTDRGR